MKKALLFLLLSCILQNNLPAQSTFEVSKLFGDHMVIQRDQAIKVWGWADTGVSIDVEFAGNKQTIKTNSTGRWIINFPSMEAGGPYEMKIWENGTLYKAISDIMLGDVWLCSGQSNMAWIVANSNDAEIEIAQANDAKIRQFKVPLTYAEDREEKLAGGEWKVASPKVVGEFTAVGYYFAKEIRKHQDVTIGLLNSSWGGSKIEAWMDAALFGFKDAHTIIENIKKNNLEVHQKAAEKLKSRYPWVTDTDKGLVNGEPLWAMPDIDVSSWSQIEVPILWESQGYENFDGIAWYRKVFYLEESETTQDLELGLGKIDDSDITWVNGVKVGGMEKAWSVERVYKIPADILKTGKNVIAVRVEDTGGGGGIHGEKNMIYLKIGEVIRSLGGKWIFKLSAFQAFKENIAPQHTPTLLYNKMINPLLDYPIKGALWYQGESNANQADKYTAQFSGMITDWRKRWEIGDFPFLYVQLANFMAVRNVPSESDWAELREAQTATLKTPNTAQAVIIDIGEADDIHPRNKQDVGLRLSLAARKLAYGEKDLVYSGPVFRDHEIDGSKIYVSFDHIGSGLSCDNRYGYVNAFAIAGEDGVFHWAKAIITGDKVTVWSNKVLQPKHVRYAWSDNPSDANLSNKEGLRAAPFRTDH